jgi:hypothetical protein
MSSHAFSVEIFILDSFFLMVEISTFDLSIQHINERSISPFGFFLLSSDELEL